MRAHRRRRRIISRPELEVLSLPGLGLPALRPQLAVAARRPPSGWRPCTRSSARPDKPQLLVTTVNAATQRTLTPFRIRQLVARLAPGERIDLRPARRPAPGQRLCPHRHGRRRRRICGARRPRRPLPVRRERGAAARFLRRRDRERPPLRSRRPSAPPATVDGFTLLPASETLLDEDSVKRFRSRYRERFGATATGDPLYQAVSEGRRLAGLDHWLPLFEERLATLFDHLGDDDIIVRDAGDAGAADARFEAIADYYENRVARPVVRSRQLPAARARDALSRRATNGRR